MRILLILSFFLIAPLQAGEIHKWVDENGNVHYGDAPPVNVSTQNVRVQSAPSNPGRTLPRLLSGDEDETGEAAANTGARSGPDPDDSPEEIACKNAREDLEVISSSARIRLQAADGTSRYMTAQEIADRKAQAEADVSQYCQ